MAIYRAVLSFPTDGVLPADEMTLSPHYAGDDAQALADRLKSNLSGFSQIGGTKPFRVRIYDAQKAPPSYPLAEASQAGTPPNSGAPRELALCLSYYSTWNRPRYRGRLYIPHLFFGGGTGARPTPTQMTAVLAWKDVLTGSLPPAHNLVVWSRVARAGYGVDNFWVDDEWDIMRSRGRKSTTRQTAKFPQAIAAAVPPRVYSERFLATSGSGWHYYQVPYGHRAVVRCISSVVYGTAASWQTVNIEGVGVWFDTNQAPATVRVVDLRHVAYSGEQIGCYSFHPDTNIIVSGYLFESSDEETPLQPPQLVLPASGPEPPEWPPLG